MGSFQHGYQSLFRHKPTLLMLDQMVVSNSFVIPANTHPTLTTLDIEDALSAFELWLAVLAPALFAHDEWLVYLVHKPISWLPTQQSRRMLAPTSLWALLQSDFGRFFTSQLAEFCPSPLHDIIHSLSQTDFTYPEHSALAVIDDQGPKLGFRPTLQC